MECGGGPQARAETARRRSKAREGEASTALLPAANRGPYTTSRPSHIDGAAEFRKDFDETKNISWQRGFAFAVKLMQQLDAGYGRRATLLARDSPVMVPHCYPGSI